MGNNGKQCWGSRDNGIDTMNTSYCETGIKEWQHLHDWATKCIELERSSARRNYVRKLRCKWTMNCWCTACQLSYERPAVLEIIDNELWQLCCSMNCQTLYILRAYLQNLHRLQLMLNAEEIALFCIISICDWQQFQVLTL